MYETLCMGFAPKEMVRVEDRAQITEILPCSKDRIRFRIHHCMLPEQRIRANRAKNRNQQAEDAQDLSNFDRLKFARHNKWADSVFHS